MIYGYFPEAEHSQTEEMVQNLIPLANHMDGWPSPSMTLILRP